VRNEIFSRSKQIDLIPEGHHNHSIEYSDQNDVIQPSTLRNDTGLTDERQQAQQLLGHVVMAAVSHSEFQSYSAGSH
jgi:hypothetical protein